MLSMAEGDSLMMRVYSDQFEVLTERQGLLEITDRVEHSLAQSGVYEGLCTVFVRHTSASLTIQENADPSARRDLEYFLNKLIPEDDPGFTHTLEGPDDMPSHIKSALTLTSLSIPVVKGRFVLGTWQGVYLWEHRSTSHRRSVVVQISGKGE